MRRRWCVALALVGLAGALPACALPSFAEVRAAHRPSDLTLLARDGTPVQTLRLDHRVRPEAPVLAQHDGRHQRGRQVLQRHPGQAAHGRVHAQRLQRHTVAVEQRDLGGLVRGAVVKSAAAARRSGG